MVIDLTSTGLSCSEASSVVAANASLRPVESRLSVCRKSRPPGNSKNIVLEEKTKTSPIILPDVLIRLRTFILINEPFNFATNHHSISAY